MAIERIPCIYILANRYNGALYDGVTSNLVGRILQHRDETFDGYTKKYGIKRLVYFEIADTMETAIAREKQLKRSVGVTSNLVGRILQHRDETFDGYTKKYGIKRLVYFEIADTMETAIAREKQLKRYSEPGSATLSSVRTGLGMILRSGSDCHR